MALNADCLNIQDHGSNSPLINIQNSIYQVPFVTTIQYLIYAKEKFSVKDAVEIFLEDQRILKISNRMGFLNQ